MARGVKITLTVKDDGTPVIQKFSTSMKKLHQDTAQTTSGLSATFGKIKEHWLGLTAAIVGTAATLRGAFSVAEEAAVFEESVGRLQRQLRQYGETAATLVPKIQQLTGGQLSLKQAVEVTSRALAAGLTPAQVQTFVQFAEHAADVWGTTIPEAMQRLQASMAAGNDRALKQIGIVVDLEQVYQKLAVAQLSTAETAKLKAKVDAEVSKEMEELSRQTGLSTLAMKGHEEVAVRAKFQTEELKKITAAYKDTLTEQQQIQIATTASMGQMQATMKALGTDTNTTADKFAAFKARLEDMRLGLGVGIQAAAVAMLGALNLAVGGLAKVWEWIARVEIAWFKFLSLFTDRFANELKAWQEDMAAAAAMSTDFFKKGIDDITASIERLKSVSDPLTDAITRTNAALNQQGAAMGGAADKTKQATTAQQDFTAALNQTAAAAGQAADAVGNLASAEGSLGGGVIGGGGGLAGILPFGDLPIASGAGQGSRKPEEYLQAIRDEMYVLTERLKPENWLGTFGANRAMLASQQLARLHVLETQALGQIPQGGVVFNINAGAFSNGSDVIAAIRNVLVPELRRLGLI